MKNLFKIVSVNVLIFSFLILTPVVASAAVTDCNTLTGLQKIICQIQQLLNAMIPVMVALGVLYFFWGIIRYVIAGDEEAKENGRSMMVYGIIGLSVIVGLWGLVNVVINTFGLSGATAPSIAQVTVTGGSICTIGPNSTFKDVLCFITNLINDSIIPLFFAIATVAFIWGVIKFFIIDADEEAKRTEGKQFMIWGIIALAVMLSIWGLVGILGRTFGIRDTSILPQVKPPGPSSQSGGGSGGGSGGVDCRYCSGRVDDPPYCASQCSGN